MYANADEVHTLGSRKCILRASAASGDSKVNVDSVLVRREHWRRDLKG